MPHNLVFAGTPDFALESLKALVTHGLAPAWVLTQPDRPAGRGRQLRASPVKRYALARGLPVAQPATLADPEFRARLAALAPRAIVVAAYGLIFPPDLLALPPAGCINVHASLLPRWRGAAPIEAAILAGDRETGISLMRMAPGVDTGAVYAQAGLAIGDDETAGELHDRLAALGGELLAARLPEVLAGRIAPVPQDERQATYAPKRRREDAKLDWRLPAATLARRVRAFDPVPGAWFELDGKAVKCWGAAVEMQRTGEAGRVLDAGADGIVVACGEGALRLRELQWPSRRRVSAAEFARQASLFGRLLPASTPA